MRPLVGALAPGRNGALIAFDSGLEVLWQIP